MCMIQYCNAFCKVMFQSCLIYSSDLTFITGLHWLVLTDLLNQHGLVHAFRFIYFVTVSVTVTDDSNLPTRFMDTIKILPILNSNYLFLQQQKIKENPLIQYVVKDQSIFHFHHFYGI